MTFHIELISSFYHIGTNLAEANLDYTRLEEETKNDVPFRKVLNNFRSKLTSE